MPPPSFHQKTAAGALPPLAKADNWEQVGAAYEAPASVGLKQWPVDGVGAALVPDKPVT